MEQTPEHVIGELIGLRCSRAQNPHGSTLTLDFGDMSLPQDALPEEKPRGWRRLTVYSPWRVQSEKEIVFDWNVNGGPNGILRHLVDIMEGATVVTAGTSPPAWDLVIDFSDALRLSVFGDFDDDREAAWFITGTDGTAISACPRARPLPSAQAPDR